MRSPIQKFYPRAVETRLPHVHPELKVNRPKFIKAVVLNLVTIQLLFLCLFCYLFGSMFQQVPRTHYLKVLWVDYDGGIIGDAVRDAYKSLQSDTFPSLVERSKSEYPSEGDLREAVCSTAYWAALYTSPGSSQALGLAISGSSAAHYNASDILTYVWNEARYPTIQDGSIANNLQALSNSAHAAYIARNGTSALSTIPPGNINAISAFANPWTLSSIDLQPTIQGSRAIYNTLVFVLILIQCFFYLGLVNGLYAQFKVYTRVSPTRIIVIRALISIVFTMFGGLLISTAIWAFKGGWNVSGKQFALNWLTLWLFAHVNFLTLDVFSIWIPAQYVPMALITWVVINVTSIIIPFDLSSPFYKWGYALPAHSAYEVLTDIWSKGCNPHLYFALPVLFAYELSGLFWTILGVFKRAHLGVLTEEATQAAMQMRIEAAVKLLRERDRLQGQENRKKTEGINGGGEYSQNTAIANNLDQGALEEGPEDKEKEQRALEETENEIERMETRARRIVSLGPCFHLGGDTE